MQPDQLRCCAQSSASPQGLTLFMSSSARRSYSGCEHVLLCAPVAPHAQLCCAASGCVAMLCNPHGSVQRAFNLGVLLSLHFICHNSFLQEDADDILADNAEDLGGEDLGGSAAHYRLGQRGAAGGLLHSVCSEVKPWTGPLSNRGSRMFAIGMLRGPSAGRHLFVV